MLQVCVCVRYSHTDRMYRRLSAANRTKASAQRIRESIAGPLTHQTPTIASSLWISMSDPSDSTPLYSSLQDHLGFSA
jgi:hypothetical protein